MSEHTPGPWIREGRFVYALRDGLNVFSVNVQTYPTQGNTLDEAEGNARLIEAAPDLLAAAKTALAIAESWMHDQLDGTGTLYDALAELQPVRDAIAKAEDHHPS